ncbi:MAG: YceI family protein [Chloroflexi bacterium]|nr:YceI family protein [Chloroflexota bacterium]
MIRGTALSFMAGLSLFAMACSVTTTAQTPTGAPAAASPAAATAPSATATTAVAAPSATASAAQPAATAAGAPAPATTAAAAPAGTLRYVIATDQTEGRYKVREQLANVELPVDAVGVTKGVSGELSFSPTGAILPSASKLTIDVAQLKSDRNGRDNYLKNNALETTKYPTVTFIPNSIEGLTWPLPGSGAVTFKLVGDMTAHGVTKPITWQVAANISGQTVAGNASTNFKFGDFGMATPRTMMVLSVADNIQLDLNFTLTKAG